MARAPISRTAAEIPLIDPEAARGSVKDPASDGSKSVLESSHFSGLAEHLVDFACVQFLGVDHPPGVFLEHHGAPLNTAQQLAVDGKRLALRFQRFAHDRADVMLMAVEQGTDFQRRISS